MSSLAWIVRARAEMLDQASIQRPPEAGPFDDVTFHRNGDDGFYRIVARHPDGSPVLGEDGTPIHRILLLGMIVRPASE